MLNFKKIAVPEITSRMSKHYILIVDQDGDFRSSLKDFLEIHNYSVVMIDSVKEAAKSDLSVYSAIVTDAKLVDGTGVELIKLSDGVPVIVTSAQASLKAAVQTMKAGAFDYLPKPYDFDELLAALKTFEDHKAATVEMLGECQDIAALTSQIEKVAPTNTNVLIHGESGTGKELVARKIHQISDRSDRQMISLNCAAIPDTLIESELFGHQKGAFVGATTDRMGLIEAADGSTLFLDEIGELPLPSQARLLRVLQSGEVRRIASVETQKVSVRLIAATHRNLEVLVATGAFREDLYYRLNVVRFSLPPLRERGGDIVLLANHFLKINAERHGKPKIKLSDAAKQCIAHYHWPGNIRELENALQRAVILCDGKTIRPELLAVEANSPGKFPSRAPDGDNVSLEDYFVKFVTENQDQFTETELAHKLGISRKSLWQKRQKLGIPREKSRKR